MNDFYNILRKREKPDIEKDGHKFWKIHTVGDFKICRHEYPDGSINYLVTIKGANCWIADFNGAESAVVWVETNYNMGFKKWNKKKLCLMKNEK